MRTLIELIHIFVGLMATLTIVSVAAWAYPLGRETIHVVGWLAAAGVVVLGIRPLVRARAIDRNRA